MSIWPQEKTKNVYFDTFSPTSLDCTASDMDELDKKIFLDVWYGEIGTNPRHQNGINSPATLDYQGLGLGEGRALVFVSVYIFKKYIESRSSQLITQPVLMGSFDRLSFDLLV